MMIGIKSITKERAVDMLQKKDGIVGFEGSFEIPLEALNLPVDERSVTSDQDVEQDAVLVPVLAVDCLRVLYQDDTKAIVSTEKMIKPGRYKNADPDWLLHLAEVFGAENILTRSETHDRVFYLQVEQRYLALTEAEQTIIYGNLVEDLEEGWPIPVDAIGFGAKKLAKELDEYELIKAQEAAEIERKAELTEQFSAMTVDELEQYCRDNNISGYSSLNKTELVAMIVNEVMQC